jgi:hypothetical protein
MAYFFFFAVLRFVFFAVFFAADFVLDLAFFAIGAALLATMRWRCRNSAVANRRALHSIYYRTIKKTVNPFKELFIPRLPRCAPRAQRASSPADRKSHRSQG